MTNSKMDIRGYEPADGTFYEYKDEEETPRAHITLKKTTKTSTIQQLEDMPQVKISNIGHSKLEML